MVKKSQAELDRMYDNYNDALTILNENKDYFSEKDYNKYHDKLVNQIEDIAGQLLMLDNESSK